VFYNSIRHEVVLTGCAFGEHNTLIVIRQ